MKASDATFPLSDYTIATCEAHEAVLEIERARELIRCMIDDKVTVLDIWRKDAKDYLKQTE